MGNPWEQCPLCHRMRGHNHLSVNVNDEVLAALDEKARRYGVTKTCLLREAISNYLGLDAKPKFRGRR